MTYIRTGTVSVTNNSQVVGVGTKFITDQILVGDAIYIDDGGVPYDVASVNSQTQLSQRTSISFVYSFNSYCPLIYNYYQQDK